MSWWNCRESAENIAAEVRAWGKNAQWPARYNHDLSRVSLSPEASGTHQVPVIVHKLTSPGQVLLDSRGFNAASV